ncbi:hypothetical protein AAHB33_19350 [Paenarthrobacter sp. S56]|uniref:hypothetical protein n=1 Tax=Paenarthrobacter sp. S56 TaxID=3138179 RepID=UPI00321BAFF1
MAGIAAGALALLFPSGFETQPPSGRCWLTPAGLPTNEAAGPLPTPAGAVA